MLHEYFIACEHIMPHNAYDTIRDDTRTRVSFGSRFKPSQRQAWQLSGRSRPALPGVRSSGDRARCVEKEERMHKLQQLSWRAEPGPGQRIVTSGREEAGAQHSAPHTSGLALSPRGGKGRTGSRRPFRRRPAPAAYRPAGHFGHRLRAL